MSNKLRTQLRTLLRKLSGQTRQTWKRIITEMGPHYHQVQPRPRAATRSAMSKHGIAEFLACDSFVVGRLTRLGVALRDHWILAEAIALDQQLRRSAGP